MNIRLRKLLLQSVFILCALGTALSAKTKYRFYHGRRPGLGGHHSIWAHGSL